MATKIVTKNSSTASAVPTASDLVQGELAVNVADKRLFTEDNGGSIIELGTNPSTIDINAGTIDGTAIGASSASTGAFTTLTATGLTVDTNTLYVDSTNNRVGIGTTSPLEKLTVASGNVRLDTSTNNWLYASDTSAVKAGFNFDVTNKMLKLYTNAAERLRIDSSGNVGIGTSSPSNDLHVSSTTGSAKLTSTGGGANLFMESADGNTTRIRWDSNTNFAIRNDATSSDVFNINQSGNVGIGTSSPSQKLHVDSGEALIKSAYSASGTTNSKMYFATRQSGNWRNTYIGNTGDALTFATGGTGTTHTNATERMRIDSSGNLLVGKSSSAFGTDGIQLNQDQLWVTNTSSSCMSLNRKGTSGSILAFYDDGSLVGSIGTINGDMYLGTGNVNLRFTDSVNDIRPVNSSGLNLDNTIDLGASGTRFDDIYATNGTIQTSDRNEKQDIAELSDAEQRVAVAAKGLLRKFRWKDSVAEKGDDARIHFGIIAQDLQAAFEAEGLDAGDYAMFISTTWTDEETNEEKTRMGVRYSELLAFIISAI
jgi:hypothetical protein